MSQILGPAPGSAEGPLSPQPRTRGAVRVEGYRKTVQHLEGGIIRKLRVREGDEVESGELLLRLDPTQAKARFEAQLNQYLALQAEEARLLAGRDGADRVTFPQALLRLCNDPRVARV
jgi:membrane fusion protein, epimerase transport system